MFEKMTKVQVQQLYPELYGATARAMAPEMTGLSDGAKLQMEMSGNTLNPTAADLWSVVAEGYADKFSKKYASLEAFSHNVENEISVPEGVRPTLNVEVIETAGEVLVNTTDWEQTALANTYVKVEADRLSRPVALNSYELANGERWVGKREAAIQSVLAGVYAKLCEAVAGAGVQAVTVDKGSFGPEVIAQEISTLFGDYGQPDVLLLSPALWGKVVPTNGLSLNPEAEGVYGIGKLAMSAGLAGLNAGGTALGLAGMKSGIAFGGGVPKISPQMGCAVRSLGKVCGIPLVLKVWGKPGSETIYESVETYAGFTVVQPQKVAVLAAE